MMYLLLSLSIVQDGLEWVWGQSPGVVIVMLTAFALVWSTVKLNNFYHRYKKTEHQSDDLSTRQVPDLSKQMSTVIKRIDTIEIRLDNVDQRLDKIDNRLDKMDNRMDKMDQRMDKMDQRMDKMDQKLDAIIIAVNGISRFLSGSQDKFPDINFTNSPLQLSNIGTSILEDIGGKKYIDDNCIELIHLLEEKSPKTGFDVDEQSTILLTQMTLDARFNPIKNYIFHNPVYRKGTFECNLHMLIVIQIMGLYLRNRYFQRYPELNEDLSKPRKLTTG